jgi:hypothetical protein
MPEADAGFEPGEFQVTRAAPAPAFASDLFATPPNADLRPGYSDRSVFGQPDLPTTQLHTPI